MGSFHNFRLSTRLATGFGLVLTLLLAVASLGVFSLAQTERRLQRIVNENNEATKQAVHMRIAIAQVAIAVRDIVINTDEKAMREVHESLKKSRAHYDEAETQLTTLFAAVPDSNAQARQILERLKGLRVAARSEADRVIELGLANKNDEASALLRDKATPAFHTWLEALAALTDLEQKLADQSAEEAGRDYETARNLLIAASALGLALGVAATVLLTRSVLRQLGGDPLDAAEIVQRIADGDLSVTVALRPGDTSSLLSKMAGMQHTLASIVTQIRTGSESIATGTSQIATGNADLSQRTEEQASNLQQTAASMEEISSTVKTNADTARQASMLADSASEVAARGGQVVGQVVGTMREISESSKKVADIIGVIDGIAFQTNILALNAAVEAARAGEQGRGFAVVASEVRSLAQRSAQSAKEIKTLIGDSVERIQAGTRQVDDAGKTMDDIVGQVKRVNELISEISAATVEQTTGIGQVSDAVNQLDQVTQQNAALVEQSAAAADSLKQQAGRLVQAVGAFRLG